MAEPTPTPARTPTTTTSTPTRTSTTPATTEPAGPKKLNCGLCGAEEVATCTFTSEENWDIHHHTCESCGVTNAFRADGPACTKFVGTMVGSNTTSAEAYDQQSKRFGESTQHPDNRGPAEIEAKEKLDSGKKK